MSLSVKNGWLDKEQRVYIIFKIEEIQDILGFSKKKAIEYLDELEKFGLVEKKRRGLGLPSILYIKSFMGTSRSAENDTSVIMNEDGLVAQDAETETESNEKNVETNDYSGEKDVSVRVLSEAEELSCVRGVDLGTSGGVENALQEVSKWAPQEVAVLTPLKSNTNINNTYKSKGYYQAEVNHDFPQYAARR